MATTSTHFTELYSSSSDSSCISVHPEMATETGDSSVGTEFQGVLGLEWSQTKVKALANNSDKVYHRRLLNTPPERDIEFADGYLKSGKSAVLSRNHLYGALVYTRGDCENPFPCHKCKDPEKRVFPKCISLSNMAQGACAADIWSNTTSDCDHHADNSKKDKDTSSSSLEDDDDIVMPTKRRASIRVATIHNSRAASPVVITRSAIQKTRTKSVAPVADMRKPTDVIEIDDYEEAVDNLFGGVPQLDHSYKNSTSRDTSGLNTPTYLIGAVKSNAGKSGGNNIPDHLMPSIFQNTSQNAIRAFSSQNVKTNSTSTSNLKKSKVRRQREEDSAESDRPAYRPRYASPVRDDLCYLQGNFDYGTWEKALELTPEMIEEAKSKNSIDVGRYKLSRFSDEMNVMWAVRVAAARWSWGQREQS